MTRSALPSFLAAALACSLLTACGGSTDDTPADSAAADSVQEPLPSRLAELTSTANTASADGLEQSAGTSQETANKGTSSADNTITATGEFTAPVRSELVARRPGRIAAVLVDEGDTVRRGQALLRLETLYVEPEVDRATAQLRHAEAQLTQSEGDFARKEELAINGSVPAAMLERSLAAYEQAQADVEAARANLAVARQQLTDSVLSAPFAGIVARRAVDPGEYLKDDTAALTLMQVDPLELRFQLAERYLPVVREGLRVEATVAPYPDRRFEGEIVRIRKIVDADSRSFSVWARFSNTEGLLQPGLFARVEITRAEETESDDAQTR